VVITLKISISTFSGVRNSSLSEPLRAFIANYSSVAFTVSIDETQFGSAFIRSISLGLGTGLVGLTISISAAYALARFKFKGNKFMTFFILSTQMFPGLILLIPQYLIWSNLGLLKEDIVIFGVLLASSTGAMAYCTWMMKGYFKSVPIEIEEAAIIDGAGRFGTFTRIALPLVKSGIIAVLLFTFITSWQDFVLARIFISQETKQTLPLLFYNFQDMTKADAPVYFDLVAPYSIMVALPVVIFFILLQKDLAAGAVAGSVK
jgi:ABC-type glycerol-3-phosphate transport system permease component